MEIEVSLFFTGLFFLMGVLFLGFIALEWLISKFKKFFNRKT